MDPIPEIPIDPTSLSRDPAVGEAYAADDLVYHGPFKRETLLAMFGAIENIATDGTLGSLPVVWVHGDQDQLAPLDVTRRGDREDPRRRARGAHLRRAPSTRSSTRSTRTR